MNDEEFIIKFYSCDNQEQFLKDVYHNLNCLQNQVEKLTQENNDLENLYILARDNLSKLLLENDDLKHKINVYENPNDVTKMFMYTDEITQDTINKLNELRGKNE